MKCLKCESEVARDTVLCSLCGFDLEKDLTEEVINEFINKNKVAREQYRLYYLCPYCGSSNFEGYQIYKNYNKQICCLDCCSTIAVMNPLGETLWCSKKTWDEYLKRTKVFDWTWGKWKPNYIQMKLLILSNLLITHKFFLIFTRYYLSKRYLLRRFHKARYNRR